MIHWSPCRWKINFITGCRYLYGAASDEPTFDSTAAPKCLRVKHESNFQIMVWQFASIKSTCSLFAMLTIIRHSSMWQCRSRWRFYYSFRSEKRALVCQKSRGKLVALSLRMRCFCLIRRWWSTARFSASHFLRRLLEMLGLVLAISQCQSVSLPLTEDLPESNNICFQFS
jgi:hypothetical protein